MENVELTGFETVEELIEKLRQVNQDLHDLNEILSYELEFVDEHSKIFLTRNGTKIRVQSHIVRELATKLYSKLTVFKLQLEAKISLESKISNLNENNSVV